MLKRKFLLFNKLNNVNTITKILWHLKKIIISISMENEKKIIFTFHKV